MVYDNKVQGMRGLEKKLLPLFSEKKKTKQNKRPKQVKALAFLCANKQTKTNEQGKVVEGLNVITVLNVIKS